MRSHRQDQSDDRPSASERSFQPAHPSEHVPPDSSGQHTSPRLSRLTKQDIFQLQRTAGNRAVAHLLKRTAQRQAQGAERPGRRAGLRGITVGRLVAASVDTRSAGRTYAAQRDADSNPSHSVIQAKFWNAQWQPLSHEALIKLLGEHMQLSPTDRDALQGMVQEKIDYLLPENPSAYEQTVRPLITAYQKQDKINVSKMIRIINSVLQHGILSQQDRQGKLTETNRASTSTDSSQGSANIHGMMLNNPNNKASAAQTAERESVNVLAEVKDDILFSGVKKRLANKILTGEERQHAIGELTGNAKEMYQVVLGNNYQTLLSTLQSQANNEQPQQIDLISNHLKESVRGFALNQIATSKRGQNELHKRMMTGFLTIYDAQQIPGSDWDIQPGNGQVSEGTLTKSQPANLMLKLVLPKFLEHYANQIANPHGVQIVFRSINYPVQGEAHVYLPSGETVVFNNQINLRWAEEIQATMQNNPAVFTHMVRGF